MKQSVCAFLRYGVLVLAVAQLATPALAQQTVTYQPSTERIANPERGFYHYIETKASDPNAYSLSQLVGYRRNEDITLLYCINYLDTFVEAPISNGYLDHFEANMNAVREAGLKCVLRFAYTKDDPTVRNEQPPFGDATKEQVLAHIDQLGPLLTKHADVIAVMQAGFIGVWGEWYYTDHFVDNPSVPWQVSATQQANRLEVVEALLTHLPEDLQVAVRYPSAKQGMLQRTTPVSAEEAFENTNLARIGFHNDCFLAGDQDFGTYRDNTDREFLAAETKYVGLGGESCQNNPPRSSCDNALAELAQFHWTYINADYHPQVLSGWESGGCMEEIEQRLGYRLVLTEGTYPLAAATGEDFGVQLAIENAGWAAPIQNRPLTLIATNTGTGEAYTAVLPAALQFWEAGATQQLDYTVCAAEGIPAGDYALSLQLPDTALSDDNQGNYAIQFANAGNLWDDASGFNSLNHTMRLTQGTENCAGPIVLISDALPTHVEGEDLEEGSFNWTLYPNPSRGEVNIELAQAGGMGEEIQLEVFDMLGRLVDRKTMTAVPGTKSFALSMTSYKPGVYAIRISTSTRLTTRMITVDK
ncbi:MAG: DUF4832 domain-containing protein [Bacteroidota bacterium]